MYWKNITYVDKKTLNLTLAFKFKKILKIYFKSYLSLNQSSCNKIKKKCTKNLFQNIHYTNNNKPINILIKKNFY